MVKLPAQSPVISMIDAEQLRKALLEQLQALRDSGVTHLACQDWNGLLTDPQLNQTPPSAGRMDGPGDSSLERQAYRPSGSGDSNPSTLGGTASPPARPTAYPPTQAGTPPTQASHYSASGRAESRSLGNAASAQPDLTPFELRLAPTERSTALQVLQAEVAACRCCPELVRHRRQTVFGVGNAQARLCFLGEAPGQEEDAQGEPFVGAAGQLLDKIITACKLTREEVFILNTIKCRPPMNRTPSDIEVQNCWQFAHRQLEIIQPEFICCLGSVAAKSLLQTGKSISQLRGVFHQYRGSRVMVTYHPAYLLRTPSAKRHVWDDMKMLMRELGVEL
jgi:DNA polymerase